MKSVLVLDADWHKPTTSMIIYICSYYVLITTSSVFVNNVGIILLLVLKILIIE